MPAEVLLDGETVMSDRYAEVTGVLHDAPSQAVLHTQCTALIGIASLPVDPSCSLCPLQQASFSMSQRRQPLARVMNQHGRLPRSNWKLIVLDNVCQMIYS